MFKNLTDNAKNLSANAKIEDMSKLFKNHMAGKPDVKNALSGVMVIEINYSSCKNYLNKLNYLNLQKKVAPKQLLSILHYSFRISPRKWRRIFRRSNARFSKSLWTRSNSTSTPAVTA